MVGLTYDVNPNTYESNAKSVQSSRTAILMPTPINPLEAVAVKLFSRRKEDKYFTLYLLTHRDMAYTRFKAGIAKAKYYSVPVTNIA